MLRRRLLRAAGALLVFLAVAGATVVWIEAEKEVRILCGHLGPGFSLEEVVRTLDTGNLLHYRVDERGGAQHITVRTRYHLTATCEMEIEGGRLIARTYRK